MSLILNVDSVSKTYSDFDLEISFSLKARESVGLIGPNGAGKSTTLGIILNYIKKDKGNISIFNLDHIKFEAKIKEQMGIVLEDNFFYRNMKVKNILKFVSKFYNGWDYEYQDELCKRLTIPDKTKFKNLSKGMKLKLALIMALSHRPKFLILDEPTSSLDPAIRKEVVDEILELKKNHELSILFSSHNMQDIELLSERILLIKSGRIILDCLTKEILSNWFSADVEKNNWEDILKFKIKAIGPDSLSEKKRIIFCKSEIKSFKTFESLLSGKTYKQCNLDELFICYIKGRFFHYV